MFHLKFSDSVSWVDVPECDGFFGCRGCSHVRSVVTEAPRRIERFTHLLTKFACRSECSRGGGVQCANLLTIGATCAQVNGSSAVVAIGGVGVGQTGIILKWYADCRSEG